jgi:hypothetical protein
MSTEIERYINKQKSPQREIIQKLRAIVLKAVPEPKERLWMGVPWYDRFYLVALKDHVNMGFSVKGLSSLDMSLFEGKGKTMRHLKFRSIEDVDEEKVVKLLKLVLEKGESC